MVKKFTARGCVLFLTLIVVFSVTNPAAASCSWRVIVPPKGVESIHSAVSCKSGFFISETAVYQRIDKSWKMVRDGLPDEAAYRLFCSDGMLLLITHPYSAYGKRQLFKWDSIYDRWVLDHSSWARVFITLHSESYQSIDEKTWPYPKLPVWEYDVRKVIVLDDRVYIATWNSGIFALESGMWKNLKGLPKDCIPADTQWTSGWTSGRLVTFCEKIVFETTRRPIGVFQYESDKRQWRFLGNPDSRLGPTDLSYSYLVLDDKSLYLIRNFADDQKSRIYQFHLK